MNEGEQSRKIDKVGRLTRATASESIDTFIFVSTSRYCAISRRIGSTRLIHLVFTFFSSFKLRHSINAAKSLNSCIRFGLLLKYRYVEFNNFSATCIISSLLRVLNAKLHLCATQCMPWAKGAYFSLICVHTPVMQPWKTESPSAPTLTKRFCMSTFFRPPYSSNTATNTATMAFAFVPATNFCTFNSNDTHTQFSTKYA